MDLSKKWAYDLNDPETNAAFQNQLMYARKVNTQDMVLKIKERVVGVDWLADHQSLGDMDNFARYSLRLHVRPIACGERQLVDQHGQLLADADKYRDIGQRAIYHLNSDEFAALCDSGMYDHPEKTWQELHDNLIGVDFTRYATVEQVTGLSRGFDLTLGEQQVVDDQPFAACVVIERGTTELSAKTEGCDFSERLEEIRSDVQRHYNDERFATPATEEETVEEPEQTQSPEILIKNPYDLGTEKPENTDRKDVSEASEAPTTETVKVDNPVALNPDKTKVEYDNSANQAHPNDYQQLRKATEKQSKAFDEEMSL